MSKNSHGKRFKPSEKHAIMEYLDNHTYKEVSERYNVSEPTLARWRKSMMSESNSLLDKKIHLVLPDFWLDYLNELVGEGSLGDNYNKVFVNILRNFAKNTQKKSTETLTLNLRNFNSLITTTMKRSPEIEAFIVLYHHEVLFATEEWGDPATILNFVQHWEKNVGQMNKIPSEMETFSIKDEIFRIRDFSDNHILAGTRCDPWWNDDNRKLLVGLKREDNNEVFFIFAKTKPNLGDYRSLMDTVNRIVMGKIPNRPETTPIKVQPTVQPIIETRESKRKKRNQLRIKRYLSILKAIHMGFSHERINSELEFAEKTIDDAIKWDQAGRPEEWNPY